MLHTLLTRFSALALAGVGVFMPRVLLAQSVKIDGSSTMFPISRKASDDFKKSMRSGIEVSVAISGTTGAFRKFCAAATDINDASRPILTNEMELCRRNGVQYLELPLAFDAITVVVNPLNNWVKDLTVAYSKLHWQPAAQGRIKTWRHVNSRWPDRFINLFAPDADSGTFDYITEAIVGKVKSSRNDYNASADDNLLVRGSANNLSALGYFGYGYLATKPKKIRPVAIDNGGGPVTPYVEIVVDGSYQPLSRPLFLYVSRTVVERPETRRFIEFYLANAAQFVKQVRSVPLPAIGYQTAISQLKQGTYGTAFGGKTAISIKFDSILKREPKS